MIQSYSPDQRIYEEEFTLNLKHQIEDIKEVIQIGYQIENLVLATIIIPNNFLPFPLKLPNEKLKTQGGDKWT